jgi:hypothetical protein
MEKVQLRGEADKVNTQITKRMQLLARLGGSIPGHDV